MSALAGAQSSPAPRSSARRSPTAGNRGQGGKWLWPSTRRRVYERDRWRCVWCRCAVAQIGVNGVKGVSVEGVVFTDGMQLRQASVDHVVPRSRGGSNRPENLITCCVQCNAKRGDLSVPAFAVKLCGTEDPMLVGLLRHLEPIRQIVRRVRAAQRRRLPSL